MYTAEVQDRDRQVVIPKHLQQPALNNLVVPDFWQSHNPKSPFNDISRLLISFRNFNRQDFQTVDIWMLVTQNTDVQHTFLNADSEHCLSLKRLSNIMAFTTIEAWSQLLLCRWLKNQSVHL